ncbi:MAG: S-layer homology domain-containing protein [Actinomycetes bacterium]|jgi:hypothetical protein|nr:hypothetical protein [Acidimicrobiia bacterium]
MVLERTGIRLLGAIIVAALLVPATAVVASDDLAADEARVVELINAERAAAGVAPLTVHPVLVDKARKHAARMAEAGRIFHSDDLERGVEGWRRLGENVGRNGSIDGIHRAFMGSTGHRRNILNPDYDAVGVGVVWKSGTPYVVEVFMDSARPHTPPFVDDDGSVHEADIIALYEMGITRGCDIARYCPDRSVTRGEFATLLVRALGLEGSIANPFDDDDRSVHVDAIETLAAHGITTGCGPRRFCPDAPVTRGEMASFLMRALDLPAAPPAGFDDTAGNVHRKAIDALAAAGITRGCSPTSFCPDDPVTRGQMASFIVRALER